MRLTRFQRRMLRRRDKRLARRERLTAEVRLAMRTHDRRAKAFDWVHGKGAYNSSTFRAYWHRLAGGYPEDRLQQIEDLIRREQ